MRILAVVSITFAAMCLATPPVTACGAKQASVAGKKGCCKSKEASGSEKSSMSHEDGATCPHHQMGAGAMGGDTVKQQSVKGRDSVQDEHVGNCPVSGEPAHAELSYAIHGTTYHFCCPSCVRKFKAHPARYLHASKT